MDRKEIKNKIESEGYVRAIIIFEVLGSPKEYVTKAIKSHITNLKKQKGVFILSEAIEEPEQDGDVWSSFAEVELLTNKLETLTWVSFQFMPASIEILEPDTLMFKPNELTAWFNDLLSKNHEVAILSQQVGSQNKQMLKSINALIRNSILICVDNKINNPADVAKKIGVKEEELEPVFEAMIQEGTLKKEGNKILRK